MTIGKEKLEPCPFCGGEVQLETVKSRAGTLYGVVCRNTTNRGCTCAMEQVPSRTAEAAIARWNMRRPMDDLKAENEALRMRVKELDLLFGRYLLGMRASVIEWQHGNGADAAMQWIWNGLRGPGELPPEDETQAQAYFDREVKQIEDGLEEVYAFSDRRRAAMPQGVKP